MNRAMIIAATTLTLNVAAAPPAWPQQSAPSAPELLAPPVLSGPARSDGGSSLGPNATPGLVDGAQKKAPLIIGEATMTEDRTIIIHMHRTGDGINVSGLFRYPVGSPRYQKVLNHLGGMNPGDTRLVPAWDEKE